MSIDRRKYSRVPLEIDLAFDNDVLQMEAILRDLSLGGANILTDAPLPVGTMLSLQLHSKPASLFFTGRVRRVTEEDPDDPEILPSMAVQFLEMTDEKREVVAELLATHGQVSVAANTATDEDLALQTQVQLSSVERPVLNKTAAVSVPENLEDTVAPVHVSETVIATFEETVQYAGAPLVQETLETSDEDSLEKLEGTVDIVNVMPATIVLAKTPEAKLPPVAPVAEEPEALKTIPMQAVVEEDAEALKTIQMPVMTEPDNAALETIQMPVMTEEMLAALETSTDTDSGTMPSVEVDFSNSSATLPAVSKGTSSRKKKRR
jgi:hypothetical protein